MLFGLLTMHVHILHSLEQGAFKCTLESRSRHEVITKDTIAIRGHALGLVDKPPVEVVDAQHYRA
jgi:hypothetical protein